MCFWESNLFILRRKASPSKIQRWFFSSRVRNILAALRMRLRDAVSSREQSERRPAGQKVYVDERESAGSQSLLGKAAAKEEGRRLCNRGGENEENGGGRSGHTGFGEREGKEGEVGFWVRDDSLVSFAKAREGRFLVLQGRWRWEWWLPFGWYKKLGLGFLFFFVVSLKFSL